MRLSFFVFGATLFCNLGLGQQIETLKHFQSVEPVLQIEGRPIVNWELFGKVLAIQLVAKENLNEQEKGIVDFWRDFESRALSSHQQQLAVIHATKGNPAVDQELKNEMSSALPLFHSKEIRDQLLPRLTTKQKANLTSQISSQLQLNIRLPEVFAALEKSGEFKEDYFKSVEFRNRVRAISVELEEEVAELRAKAWEGIMEEISDEDREKLNKYLLIDGLDE